MSDTLSYQMEHGMSSEQGFCKFMGEDCVWHVLLIKHRQEDCCSVSYPQRSPRRLLGNKRKSALPAAKQVEHLFNHSPKRTMAKLYHELLQWSRKRSST